MAEHATSYQPIVAIPCKNEAKRIPKLLQSLARQTWCRHRNERLRVELIANNCTDASVAVATACAATFPSLDVNVHEVVFRQEAAHVGTARQMAMDCAWRRLDGTRHGVILTTDADAAVAADWVEETIRAFSRGADAVGGHIIGDPIEEAMLPTGVLQRAAAQIRYDQLCDEWASYLDPIPHDPWPRHRDHTGGSLALKASVYAKVGGLPPLPFREDLALVRRIRAAGYILVHPRSVRVEVSARMMGRAPGGMAECLKIWAQCERRGKPHLVQAPQCVERRLVAQRALRSTGDLLGIELLDASELDVPGTVPVHAAIAELEHLLQGYREIADAA